MVVTRTPYRVSLFGGGSDYPQWYREHGGEVISFSINKYCYITARFLPPFFEHRYRICYSRIELSESIEEIVHPAVRAALQKYCPHSPLEITHAGDLPARSGIGSSSAFAVGLIHSLFLLNGKEFSKTSLADAAIDLEQRVLGENVGSQDQIACAVGGLNYIRFGNVREWDIEKIALEAEKIQEIEDRIVLIYTGLERISSDIQANLLLGIRDKTALMRRTIQLARECRDVLLGSFHLDDIGELLNESWYLKKQMNSYAVTPQLQELWDKSQKAGALGGKVLGAGGGGFCMFWVRSGHRERFLARLGVGIHVPAKISFEGSARLSAQ
jgi:D-glycero-alpha-D-manno-heptose-7-phosphate kinase